MNAPRGWNNGTGALRAPWPALAAALVIAASLAGCTGPGPAAGAADVIDPGQGPAVRARVVVAVLESGGTNPYHADFFEPGQQAHPATYLAGYPADAVALDLTLDAPSYESAVENDTAAWQNATDEQARGVLHYVPGTNIVGLISFGGGLLDTGGHQTGTTSLVAGNVHGMAPDADLVVISGDIFAGMQWAAAQPWIDAISVSLGAFLGPCAVVGQWCGLPLDVCTGNPFLPVSYVHHTRTFAQRGGAVFGAAGYGCGSHVAGIGSSYPGNTLTSFFSGPSWIMTVGTYGEDTQQGEWEAAYPVDVLSSSGPYPAAATQAIEGNVSFGHASGAIPRAAGIYASILIEARRLVGDTGIDAGHGPGATGPAAGDEAVLASGSPVGTGPLADGVLTSTEMERVFLHSARHVDAVQSMQASGDPVAWAQRVMPAPPEAEFLTQGHGLVEAETIAVGRAILLGEMAPQREREDRWQQGVDAARDGVWGTIDDHGLYVI